MANHKTINYEQLLYNFISITNYLNLKSHMASNAMDIEQITTAFNNHVSIKNVRKVFPEISLNNLKLTKVTQESIKNEILILNTKK